MYSSAILRGHDLHRDIRITFTLFQSLRLIVDLIDDSIRFPPQQYQTHQDATSHNTDEHPSSCCPTICSLSIDPRFLHGSRFHSNFTRRCSLYQCYSCQAREAREKYLVSIVSFGAELGRPFIRLMSQQFAQHHQTFPIQMFRHQVCGIDCASDLLDPELLVLLFLVQPKVLRFHMLDCVAPASESLSASCCSICPDSYLSSVSKLSYRVGQSDGLTCTAYHAEIF